MWGLLPRKSTVRNNASGNACSSMFTSPPPPNISVPWYTPVSQETLVCPEPGPYLLGRTALFLGGTNTTKELICLRQHWWPNARSLLRNSSPAISCCNGKPPATCPFTIDFWRPLLSRNVILSAWCINLFVHTIIHTINWCFLLM